MNNKKEMAAIFKSFIVAADGAATLQKRSSAEYFYQEALSFSARHFGQNSAETGLANFCLSMFYLEYEQLPEATRYANIALAVFTQLFGNRHKTTAIALHQLAEVLSAQKMVTMATSIRKRASQILEEHLDFSCRSIRQSCIRDAILPSADFTPVNMIDQAAGGFSESHN